MITMGGELKTLRHEALQRQARQRLDLLDDMRAADRVRRLGLNQRKIAEVLSTSQAKVHRLLKAVDRRQDQLEQDPEEIILRAFVFSTPRRELLEKLKGFSFTYGTEAPYPHEGRIPGTWDQVVAALMQDMLSTEEFEEIRAAVGR